MIVFDFDRTLIEDDSDRWVLTKMGLTQLFRDLRPTLPWNSLMDRLLEELHIRGKSVDDIAECLKEMPLHPNVVAVIKYAHALGCDLKVASDSNQFYIRTILEHNGIYSCFSEIITNPAVVDEGRLRIFPYHGAAAPHGCNLCPSNLCKGRLIEQIQVSLSESESKRLIYLGDGNNDFCPALKLAASDYVMPKKDFPLSERIMKNPQVVKAEVCLWNDSKDLARILGRLIDGLSNEDKISPLTTQP